MCISSMFSVSDSVGLQGSLALDLPQSHVFFGFFFPNMQNMIWHFLAERNRGRDTVYYSTTSPCCSLLMVPP